MADITGAVSITDLVLVAVPWQYNLLVTLTNFPSVRLIAYLWLLKEALLLSITLFSYIVALHPAAQHLSTEKHMTCTATLYEHLEQHV